MPVPETMLDAVACDPSNEGILATDAMREAPGGGWHEPVLGADVVRFLNPRPGGVIVDGTVGTGGHSLLMLPHVLPNGRVVAIDRDPEALHVARQRLREFAPQVTYVHGNFRHLPALLQGQGLSQVDGVLLDLGMSSFQLDQSERGFSFSREGLLDMRMDSEEPVTAHQLVNRLSAHELAGILERFGEERYAERIARRIVEARRRQPLTTTTQLAELILQAVPAGARHARLHAATRTFQALRIAVNDELAALEDCLRALPEVLAPGGRAVTLSFHSLEDRLIKRAFAEGARQGTWTLLTKHPARPLSAELAQNPRARSAKLRAVERC